MFSPKLFTPGPCLLVYKIFQCKVPENLGALKIDPKIAFSHFYLKHRQKTQKFLSSMVLCTTFAKMGRDRGGLVFLTRVVPRQGG